MVLKKEIAIQIKDLLKENPQGLSITDIVKVVNINRNTAGRYLENLLISGQVEMRRLGMAKIYALSQRVPLSAVLSISSELVMQLDSSLRIIFANEPFLKLVDADNKTLIGKNIEYTPVATVFNDSFPEFIRNIREGLAGKEWAGEILLPTKDLIFFCRIAPTVFDDGRKGVSVILEDITGKKRAELTLQESEERYRQLVDISPDAVIIHRHGKIIFMNPAAFNLIGASHSDEIIGKNMLDFIHPDFHDAVRKNIEKDLVGDITPPMELHMLRMDGTPIIVEGRGVKTFIDGKPALQVAIRDITERKHAEEALHESEGKLNAMLQSIADPMSMMDKDLTIMWANEPAKRYFGKNIIGKKCYEVYHLRPDPCEPYPCLTLKAFLDGKTHQHDTTVIDNQGEKRFFECTANVALRDNSGKPVAVLETSRDITDRKKAEEALRESEEKYRTLIDRANDGICVVQDSIVKMCNRYLAVLWGGSVEQILGKDITEFIHPDALLEIVNRYNRRMAGEPTPSIYETVLKRKDGSRFYAELNAGIISYEGQPADFIIIRDMNDRKKAQTALRESEEKYRTLVDQANDVICIIQDGRVKMCNARLTEFWGGPIEDMLGRPFTDFVHPDAFADVVNHYNRRMSGESLPSIYETILIRKDGSRSYVEVNAVTISYEGKTADLVIIRDINDRKKAEEALRESEATARALINAPTDSVILMDKQGVILALNETAALRFGKQSDELVGILADNLLPEEIAKTRRSLVAQVLEKKEMVRFEDERDGSWYDTVAYPIVSDTGEVNRIAIIARDITDRRNTEEALIQSEQRFRNLITAIGDIVWETDAQARFVYVSPLVETILGYKPDELIGRTPFEFLHPDAIGPNQKKVQTAVERHEKSILHVSHWIHKDGHGILLESSAIPMYDSNGSFSGFIGIDRQR